MIRKMSDRDHVLQRPAMYIGAVDPTKTSEYLLEDGKVVFKEIEVVPGLLKIINEIIDNSVDVAIKTNFESCNQISVKMGGDHVEVQDNGTGIPVKKNPDGHYFAELAWGHARAGSNFDDDENRTQMGMNGVGSYATNCFSEKFVGVTDDGVNRYTISFKDNADSFTETVGKSTGRTGVKVKFWPDFFRFGVSGIDETHMAVIQQRLINLSMSFPKIIFKFNGKKINVNTFRKYVSLFSSESEVYETEDYKIAILPNPEDDFRHFSYVNGLKIPDGGTHIDAVTTHVVTRLRDRLARRYKTIKPGDIKNKIMVVVFMKNFKNPKFNSQAKEKITNGAAEITRYFGDIPYDSLVDRIYKNKAIIDPITEVYRIKEEFKKRQELKELKKSSKKIRSEKYLPSIGKRKYLMLVEGESAFGGLSPVLGRKECGYYILRGKPLNAYTAPQAKFTNNKELSELYKIIQNEGYEYVVFANDADLDGMHIAGLLLGFFHRYLPELKGRVGRLLTPVKYTYKKGVPVNWVYSLDESLKVKKGEEFNYMKGLGSWPVEDLKYVLDADGLGKMIQMFDFNDEEIMDEWLGNNSEYRKKYILDNDFDITMV